MPYDNNVLVKVDTDGTITYGNNDTEHLTRNPAMKAKLIQGIADLDAGKGITVTINVLPDGTTEIRSAYVGAQSYKDEFAEMRMLLRTINSKLDRVLVRIDDHENRMITAGI